MADDEHTIDDTVAEIEAIHTIEFCKVRGLDSLVDAVAALLAHEFSQVLRPASSMAWKKCAAGIVKAFTDADMDKSLRGDWRSLEFVIPFEKIEEITGEPPQMYTEGV